MITPIGQETITVTGSAADIFTAAPRGTSRIEFDVYGGSIVVTKDGTTTPVDNPPTNVGHIYPDSTLLPGPYVEAGFLGSDAANKYQAVSVGSATVTVYATYWG